MKISAIICAAGRGERAGFCKNKLLAPLNRAPALWWTLNRFAEAKINIDKTCAGFDEVIVAAAPCDKEEIGTMCKRLGFIVTEGGNTRTESVYNALKIATGDVVLIHDGARPYVGDDVFSDCIKCVREHGSAVCARPATDTTATVENGSITAVPDRNALYSLQTPQAFYLKDILPAYEKAITDGQVYTDDSSVYLRYVGRPHVFIGPENNRKLTYRQDFEETDCTPIQVAGKRVGIGVDTHAFGKALNYVVLGGVKIPCDEGLIAHSDGDVVVHAVMDALLSAAGLYDIGHYFPDNEDAYLNADSMILLKKVIELIGTKGLTPAAVSIAVQAEKPRLGRYIDDMKRSLSSALGIDAESVGITVGTCEGLGYVGNGLGITVQAIALLR